MKRILAKSLPIVLLTAGLMILSGCFNLLNSPQEREGGRGSLTIQIGGSPAAARTLYPNAIFTRYELSFTPHEGQAAYGPKSIDDGTSSVVIDDIEHGLWEITAKGYVTIGEAEYEAASAPAQTVTISGSPQSISFILSARNESGGDPGIFSYSVAFPADKVVSASLTLFDPETQDWVQDSGGNPLYRDLAANPTGQISLNPGYYLMQISLQNQYQRVARTEIVHIYSNMETTANYTVTEADFTDFITLSGTVNVTINGDAPNYASVYLYDNPEGNGQPIGNASVNLNTGAWSLNFDLPASTATYSIAVQAYGNGRSYQRPNVAGPITVDPAVPPAPIDIGTIDFSSVTLSGTVNLTVNGNAPQYVGVSAYTVSNKAYVGSAQVNLSTGAWTISIDPFDTPTEVYFMANVQTAERSFSYEPNPRITRTVSGSDISDIDLGTKNFAAITLSGTVNLTVNGNVPQYVGVSAYTVSNDWPMYVGSAQVNLSTGAWTISIDAFDTPTEVYFTANAQTAERSFSYEPNPRITRTISDSDISDIDLGTKNFAVITLSGTVTITINGDAANGASLYLYDNPEGYGQTIGYASVNPDTGEWSMSIAPPDSTATYYIEVHAWDKEGSYWKPNVAPIIVDPASPPSPIPLGTIDFSSIILSGTIEFEPTINGYPIDGGSLMVIDNAAGTLLGDGKIREDGTWTITIEPFSGSVSFVVEIYISTDSGEVVIPKIETRVLNGTTQSIDLGNIDAQATNLTVSFTQGGKPIEAALFILKEDFAVEDFIEEYSLLVKVIAYTNDLNTSWTIPIPSPSPASVWFLVMTEEGFYKTANAVNISSGSVNLEINELELLELGGPAPDPEPMMTQSRNLLRSKD
jgi:hypothetical protein